MNEKRKIKELAKRGYTVETWAAKVATVRARCEVYRANGSVAMVNGKPVPVALR